MLVITRTAGTTIMVGDDLEVDVIAIQSDAVELEIKRRELKGRLTTETTQRLRMNERIDLGDGCACTLIDLRYDKARLGLMAPKTTPVHRKEVWESIRRRGRGDA